MCRLYRQILKLHQVFLENETQREFGDRFVKSEFRRHRVANEKYAMIFYKGWVDYGVQLERGVTSREMTETEKHLLSDEQKEKLRQLRQHALEMRRDSGDFFGGLGA